ncbi:hypothetical protein PQ472_11080 [Lacticaseibacillus pabuli]|uniref:Uncharacterized protein n=1 Tax=Lacticaseibacillus pabuli TaxID=3025672 RepID=A0ABY7WTQ2_9LACO|nr:hypothetical protein [Lacticaseibacillus sp. KACC 23028]WDF82419.1 hypothetical protein PQ472_11080 [Lacticaseibacillus sp. KACC 23028]
MTNKTLLVVLNAGLLLVMFSRIWHGGAADMMMLDGIAIAGIAGVMYWRRAKHAATAKQKEDN